VSTVQDKEFKDALAYYTSNGPLGQLLDGKATTLTPADFLTFGLSTLILWGPEELFMELEEKSMLPVLAYIFRYFEQSLAIVLAKHDVTDDYESLRLTDKEIETLKKNQPAGLYSHTSPSRKE
jgi:type IV secretory pathway VirB4 component